MSAPVLTKGARERLRGLAAFFNTYCSGLGSPVQRIADKARARKNNAAAINAALDYIAALEGSLRVMDSGCDKQHERIDALEAERDALLETVRQANDNCFSYLGDINALKARVAALEAALRYYADGEPCCPVNAACGHERCEFPTCATKQFPKWDGGTVAKRALNGDTTALRAMLVEAMRAGARAAIDGSLSPGEAEKMVAGYLGASKGGGE